MKTTVTKRTLPLDVKYVCIDKKYIPLMDGNGTTCDNCGRLIANIATIKSINGTYNIGFDCLENFLLNNQLLEHFSLETYEKTKKWISQIIRISKKLKETIDNNPTINITGMAFEKLEYNNIYYPFMWLKNNELKGRDNDYVKAKDMDFEFMIETLHNIFPKLNIIVQS